MKTYTIEFTFDNNGRVRMAAKSLSLLNALNQLMTLLYDNSLPDLHGRKAEIKQIKVISIK